MNLLVILLINPSTANAVPLPLHKGGLYIPFDLYQLRKGNLMKKAYYENKTIPYYSFVSQTLTRDPHFHKEIEIVYVIKGSTVAYADADCFELKEGDIYISFPNQIHHYENTEIGEYFLIIANPELIFGAKDLLYNNIPKVNALYSDNNALLQSIISQYRKSEGEYYEIVQVGLINELMGNMLPKFSLKSRGATDNSTIQNIFKYCSDNFNNKITLANVSDNLHLSVYHISRLLNSKVGLGFSEYINMLRINRACELLEETDMKTSEISEEVGFGSIRSFNRAFIEQSGLTPLKYRKKIRCELNQK